MVILHTNIYGYQVILKLAAAEHIGTPRASSSTKLNHIRFPHKRLSDTEIKSAIVVRSGTHFTEVSGRCDSHMDIIFPEVK